MNLLNLTDEKGVLHNGTIVGGEANQILTPSNAKDGRFVWGTDEDIIKQLEIFNSINLLKLKDKEEITSKGITYKIEDGILTISGTSETWFSTIDGSATSLPEGWNVGDTLFIYCPSENSLYLRVYVFEEGQTTGTMVFQTNTCGIFTVPSGYAGMMIRFQIPTGSTVPPTVIRPFIGKNLPPYVHRGLEKPPAMLTIIDDDGYSKFYTQLLPIIEEKKVPISSAIVVSRAENEASGFMTWEQIEDAHKRGAEILNHTYDHLTSDRLDSMTVQEIWLNYQKAANILAQHGIQTNDILVFAGASASDKRCQQAAKQVSRMAFHAGNNKMAYRNAFNIYDIPRYRLYSDYGYDLDKIKELIDECIANGGWMVWMIHTSEANWTSEVLATISSSIDYAIEQGLPIVTAETGYRFYVES